MCGHYVFASLLEVREPKSTACSCGHVDMTSITYTVQGFDVALCSRLLTCCRLGCCHTCAANFLLSRFQSQLMETESSLSKLREQQRHAEDRSSHGQAQLGMMQDLLQLLQLKQQMAVAAAAAVTNPGKAAGRDALFSAGQWAPAGPAAAAGGSNTNVMVL